MGLFDDTTRLFNRSFPWALGRYRVGIDDDIDRDIPPPDLDSVAVFVDDEGKINTATQLVLHEAKDPVASSVEQTYSKDNLFIEGLKKAVNPFPLYGVILYPVIRPNTVEVERGKAANYPTHTPQGFVPCAGQVLKYADGKQVVVPNLVSRLVAGGAGDGAGSYMEYLAPPGMAYMMRVEEGWVESVPNLEGKSLSLYGTPYSYGFWW